MKFLPKTSRDRVLKIVFDLGGATLRSENWLKLMIYLELIKQKGL